MGDIEQQIGALLLRGQTGAGIGALFASAAIEYVFPPFPGDAIVLFGAFLAAAKGWSVPLVFVASTLGSVAGAAVDYAIGMRLVLKPVDELSLRARKARKALQPLLDRFYRHGAIFISVNRFVPGIRPLFFVAAGMTGFSLRKALLLGAVSAAVWNGVVIAAGFAVGKNWGQMLSWFKTYSASAWICIGAAVAILSIRFVLKRRNAGLSLRKDPN